MRITRNTLQRGPEAVRPGIAPELRPAGVADVPAGAGDAGPARRALHVLREYDRAVEAAGRRAGTEAAVLDQLGDALRCAQRLGREQAGDAATPAGRAAAGAELDRLLALAVQLGNTRMGERYLFGGQWSDQPPFTLAQSDFLRRDASGQPVVPQGEADLAAGSFLRAHHDGERVFLDSGALHALRSLSDALAGAGPGTEIGAALTRVGAALARVEVLVGEIDACVRHFEVARANLRALESSLHALGPEVDEDELEQAVLELVRQQTSYQAAMLATSRIMG